MKTQWEYLILSAADPKKAQQMLAACGDEGWELVSGQYAILHTGVPAYMMWLKRPKREIASQS